MRASNEVQIIGAVGLCLLSAPFGRWLWGQTARPPQEAAASRGPLAALQWAPAGPVRSPSREALRDASKEWIRARQVVARELEARLETEPDGVIAPRTDAYREQRAELDPGGHLQRARAAARRAAALAETSDEACRAASLNARIECDAGHHRAELQWARSLTALGPRRREALEVLKHAAICNGLTELAHRVDRALETIPVLRGRPPGR